MEGFDSELNSNIEDGLLLPWIDEDVSRQAKNTKKLKKNYLKAKNLKRLGTGIINMRRTTALSFTCSSWKVLETGSPQCCRIISGPQVETLAAGGHSPLSRAPVWSSLHITWPGAPLGAVGTAGLLNSPSVLCSPSSDLSAHFELSAPTKLSLFFILCHLSAVLLPLYSLPGSSQAGSLIRAWPVPGPWGGCQNTWPGS